jgi:two-component system sensor histidine kinase KdpD
MALLAAVLIDRLRSASAASARQARQARLLQELSVELLHRGAWMEPPLRDALAELASALHASGAALLVRAQGIERLDVSVGTGAALAAAESAWADGAASGAAVDTSGCLLAPIAAGEDLYGVVAVDPGRGHRAPDGSAVVESLANVVALACQRTRYHEQLVAQKVLDETERLRARLLQSVTHDLRTPVTAIRALAAAVGESESGAADEQARELLREIDAQATRMARLVDNVLDMSRLDEGRLVARPEAVPLDEIVLDAINATAALQAAGVDAAVSWHGEPSVAWVDPTLTRQVLVNLLENAITHGAAPVEIACSERDHRAEVRVIDHGDGIPERERRRVFDPDLRAEQRRGSTGLGLAICHGFTTATGGTISLAGTPGGGCTFVVRLPLASAHGGQP